MLLDENNNLVSASWFVESELTNNKNLAIDKSVLVLNEVTVKIRLRDVEWIENHPSSAQHEWVSSLISIKTICLQPTSISTLAQYDFNIPQTLQGTKSSVIGDLASLLISPSDASICPPSFTLQLKTAENDYADWDLSDTWIEISSNELLVDPNLIR